jgi:hypothetical protein
MDMSRIQKVLDKKGSGYKKVKDMIRFGGKMYCRFLDVGDWGKIKIHNLQ